jgi:hypothetical protein
MCNHAARRTAEFSSALQCALFGHFGQIREFPSQPTIVFDYISAKTLALWLLR